MYSLLTMADVQLAAGGLSVIGHDDLPTSELLAPPLATIRDRSPGHGARTDEAAARTGAARRLHRGR
jgi:DNA-binding LacI/PurR family transcriptional regulator